MESPVYITPQYLLYSPLCTTDCQTACKPKVFVLADRWYGVVRCWADYQSRWKTRGLLSGLFSKHRILIKVCIEAHQARAYPGFRSMTPLGVFLLPPGWDASLPQGYP